MRIRPFEELEAIARKRYQAIFANAPRPEVVNLEALRRSDVCRKDWLRFEVGGLGLRAPPLPFMTGVRLLVAGNALRALRERPDVAPGLLARTVRNAALELSRAVRPIRLRDRLRGGWLARLIAAGPEAIEQVCLYLVHVPDETTFPPATRPTTFDFMDAVVAVCRAFPAWVDPKTGFPRTWALYVYGSRHLARARAREILSSGDAARMAFGADQKEYRQWTRDLAGVAGWN